MADLLKLCLKIFWSATYMEVPAALLQPDAFAAWMTALHTLVTRPVPAVCPRHRVCTLGLRAEGCHPAGAASPRA